MDEFDEQYENGFTEGYEWGKFVMEVLDDREPLWLPLMASHIVGTIAELPDTAEVRAIRKAMIQARNEWEERRN